VIAALLQEAHAVAQEAAPAAAGAAPSAALEASRLAGSLSSYLVVSGLLFLLGVAVILVRRNALYVLMGVELILNAANLNFVAFARFGGYGLDGQMFALFTVILAAAEAAIALAIVLRIFNDFGSIDITRTDSLRD
jgi:NADH-quinone oxidoreductase subunit K